MIAYLYSDVSQRHMAIGYCCIIDRDGHSPITLAGDLTEAGHVSAAEIEGLAIALEHCPAGAECVLAYTDLVWLPSLLQGKADVSYRASLGDAIQRIRDAAARFPRVEWRVVNRKHSHYHKCHCESRRQAVEAARQRGTLNLHPINETPPQENVSAVRAKTARPAKSKKRNPVRDFRRNLILGVIRCHPAGAAYMRIDQECRLGPIIVYSTLTAMKAEGLVRCEIPEIEGVKLGPISWKWFLVEPPSQ